jgi:hypothetical protein
VHGEPDEGNRRTSTPPPVVCRPPNPNDERRSVFLDTGSDTFFRLERDVRSGEFDANRASVRRLDQSWPELSVDGDATTNDSMREIFEVGTEIRVILEHAHYPNFVFSCFRG